MTLSRQIWERSNNSFKPTQLRGGNVLRLGRSYFAAATPVGLTQALDLGLLFLCNPLYKRPHLVACLLSMIVCRFHEF